MAMFNGVNFPMYPISDVQPFTYRDSRTSLELIEDLRQYINTALIPGINDQIDTLIKNYQAALDEMESRFDIQKQDVLNIVNQFKTDIQSIVDCNDNRFLRSCYHYASDHLSP